MTGKNNRILLINPNRYSSPPVIPVGLEYIAASLLASGYDTHILDLCFEAEPVSAIRKTIAAFGPLVAGITVRNIDSALFNNNIFFLPQITSIVSEVKKENIPVILGGAGFSAAPETVLRESGADYGIEGPAEVAITRLIETLFNGKPPEKKVLSGWNIGIDPTHAPTRPVGIDYRKYLDNGGIIGFATQYGCTDPCPYCIEAGKRVHFREPEAVIKELSILTEKGYENFHLCDSEYNLDLGRSVRFAKMLADASLPMKWSVYMKPAPWSEELFYELKRSGASTITLSVDSFVLSSNESRYCFSDIENIIRICRELEIKSAVDLLTGYPEESPASTVSSIEFFKKHRPDTVGVNAYFRVYPHTKLCDYIKIKPDIPLNKSDVTVDSSAAPIFYNHLSVDELRELIGGDPLFRIEGFDRTTNYARFRDLSG